MDSINSLSMRVSVFGSKCVALRDKSSILLISKSLIEENCLMKSRLLNLELKLRQMNQSRSIFNQKCSNKLTESWVTLS